VPEIMSHHGCVPARIRPVTPALYIGSSGLRRNGAGRVWQPVSHVAGAGLRPAKCRSGQPSRFPAGREGKYRPSFVSPQNALVLRPRHAPGP
jgi:hypothetical protein